MSWDSTKATQTRDGCEVTDLRKLIEPLMEGGVWAGVVAGHLYSWNAVGKFYAAGGSIPGADLVNIEPERIKRNEAWRNVYEGWSFACKTRHHADQEDAVIPNCRLACIPIEIDCEVGEGLEEKIETARLERWLVLAMPSTVTAFSELDDAVIFAQEARDEGYKSGIIHIREDVPVR